MQQASPKTDSIPRRVPRFLRTLPGKILVGAIVLGIAIWAPWYNEHRTLTWGQTFNPIYWWHRYRGDDLFDPSTRFLLHGNRALHEVALTFDDGPHAESRGRILDTLRQFGVHATFFDVGSNMEANPDLLNRTLAEGHEVANHSYHHFRLINLSNHARHREINDTDVTFFRITGRHLTLLRPPGMRYNDDALAETKRLGYVVVGYTTSSRDFEENRGADYIVERTLHRTENGSIILLHDYPSTAEALPRILAALQKQGYRFVTVSEMIRHLPDLPNGFRPSKIEAITSSNPHKFGDRWELTTKNRP